MITVEQTIVFGVLALALVLFIWGRWRYDLVALLALLIVTITGLVPGDTAFVGFGHPAVVTVAAVLVASRGLQNAGVIDEVANLLGRLGNRPTPLMAALTGLVAFFSAFMNNVGALALLMPATIQTARKRDLLPSRFLMPLAFASLLGGMTTLIGTPPNIIIATFRAETNTDPFGMFDFTPVGLGVALAGLLFIWLGGWRLIPQRKSQAGQAGITAIQDYLTEVRVPENTKMVGKPLYELNQSSENTVVVVGVVRGKRRIPAPSAFEPLNAGDILIIEADSEGLQTLIDATGFELVGSEELAETDLKSENVTLIEVVIRSNSLMEGRTARSLDLRRRYGVNLLAVARQGERLRTRLDRIRFRTGDVLLLQGPIETLQEVLPMLGGLPLAERRLRIGQPRRQIMAMVIFGAALLLAAFGQLPVQIAFTSAAAAMVFVGLLTLREAYESIDWSILVLLGAMIPVGQALETTGGAQLLAGGLLQFSDQMPPVVTLVIVLVGTMFLSDLINNAAAALLMAPIAISLAEGLNVSADPFLISVAIGASCAFLTPIGHQSNTLVMGPGGYKFSDYWRLGLPLEILIVVVAVPLILWFWPL